MITMENKKFFKIGKVKKINEKNSITFSSFYNFLSLNIDFVFFQITRCYIPFKIKIEKNNIKDYKIIFDDITNYELNFLKGQNVFIELDDMNKLTLQSNTTLYSNINLGIIGYTVTNINDPIFNGEIIDILQNKQQDIIKVKYNNNEILVPYVQQLIIECNNNSKKIVMNIPQGLY